MRKNRFLMNLIAATAIGLAAIGCDSSDSGAVQSNSDITLGSNANNAAQTAALREYVVVGQRGLFTSAPTLAANNNQSAPNLPNNLNGEVVAAPGDANDVARALLFELVGISATPTPGGALSGPGDDEDPTALAANDETTGAHGVYVDPTGNYVVTIARTKNRGFNGDAINGTNQSFLEVHALVPQAPFDQEFPPVYQFGPVADVTPILFLQTNQGQFVSGAWSPDAKNFYAGVNGRIFGWTANGFTGGLTEVVNINFPADPANPNSLNNAAELLFASGGANLYAIDNANATITHFARNTNTGALTQMATTNLPSDPRGMTVDRTGNFLYVASRSSMLVSGFRINADGSLTAIEVSQGLGAVPVDLTNAALGDIDANPQRDQLYVSSYNQGVLRSFNIDPATGRLTAAGASGVLLNNATNSTNIEVDPTGQFVLSVNEHDLEEFQTFANEFPAFANLDTATNDPDTGTPFSGTGPQTDDNGLTVFVTQNMVGDSFSGSLQVARINADGTLRYESSRDVRNPYGIDFFQKVVSPNG